MKRYRDLEELQSELDNEGIAEDPYAELEPEDLELIRPKKPKIPKGTS